MFNGQYIYPPRTKMKTPFYMVGGKKIAPIVGVWQRYPDAIAQYKLNGSRNIIHVAPNRSVTMWNRHQEIQKYTVPATMRDQILQMSPEGKYSVWDTELMHFKTTDIKNMLYVYDVLVWDNEPLHGKTYQERYEIVQDAVSFIADHKNGQVGVPLDVAAINASVASGQHIFLAQNFAQNEWQAAWDAAKSFPWVEGLVLKRAGYVSRLQAGTQEINNDGFQCRVRKPHKNYLH